MPAVNEKQDERMTFNRRIFYGRQRGIRLLGIPEPALIVRFDKLQIVSRTRWVCGTDRDALFRRCPIRAVIEVA
ncbi:hypothetical protein D3C84_1169550 [compost metagenome]